MKKKTKQGETPLYLSTLSALSILLLVMMIFSTTGNLIIKFLLAMTGSMFSMVVGSNIKKMIKYKNTKITPNQIKKLTHRN